MTTLWGKLMLLVSDRGERNTATSCDSPHRSEMVDLVSFVSFLKRNTAFTAASVIIFMLLAGAYVSLVPPRYTARTTLLFDVKKPRAVQDQDAIPINIAELGYVESQVVVLQSALTLERVVEHLDLLNDPEFTDDGKSLRTLVGGLCPPLLSICHQPRPLAISPVERLRGIMAVQRMGASHVIEISVTLRDKERAALIANTVLSSYMEVQTTTATRLTQEAISWLERRIDDLRLQALEADKRLQEFKAGSGVTIEPSRRAFMLRNLLSTADSQQALYQGFLNRYAQSAQQLSFPLSDVRVLTPATPPSTRAGPSGLIIICISGLTGMMLGLSLAAVRERLDRKVWTVDQVENEVGLPCLAALSSTPRTRRAGSRAHPVIVAPQQCSSDPASNHLREVLLNPESEFSRETGVLFARMEKRLRDNRSTVIGVVGLGARNQQLLLTSNLAMLAAALGRKVLLIDGDWRRAELTGMLAPGANKGGVETALEQGPIGPALYTEPQNGLSFLPSRAVQEVHRTLLVSSPEWISHAVQQAREDFTIVIVDIRGGADTGDGHRAIEAVDELLLVCRAGELTIEKIQDEVRKISEHHDRIIGIALTHVPTVANR